MNKSYHARLAALEALEAEAEQARDNGPPDLEMLDAPQRFGYLVAALRRGVIRTGEGFYPPPIRLALDTPLSPMWATFRAALIAWAQPILDTWGGPFVPLFGEEITQAIAVIDSGRAYTHATGHRGGVVPVGYWLASLNPSEEEHTLLQLVNLARRLVHWQLDYPCVVGAHELRTVDEWRAWLVSLMEELDYATAE